MIVLEVDIFIWQVGGRSYERNKYADFKIIQHQECNIIPVVT